MTKQELGQKIKEKYSQYQGIDDEILADKIIEKYPSYASQITDTPSIKSSVKGMLEQKTSGIRNAISGSATALKERGQEIKEAFVKSKEGDISPVQGAGRIVGSTIGGAGDILFNVIKEGVRAISPETVELAKKGVSKIGETKVVQDISTAYSNWASKNPEAAKDLSAIANIASVLPAERAVALGGKALVKGGTKVIEKGLETGLKTTGKGLKVLGTSGEKAGKTLVSAALPPKEMAGRVLSYKAKTPLVSRFKQAMEGVEKAPVTPADVVIKYNLPTVSRSGIGIKAKRIANQLFENQVKPTLKGIKERISKNEVFDGIQKTINKEVDISRRKALQTAFDALSEDYSKVSNWSAKTLDEIKSGLTKRLPSKVWQGQDIAGDMNNVRKIFSDEARKAVRSRLPENVITIYDDYGALRDVEKMGTKALQSGLNQGMIGLTGEALRITTVPTATALGTGISKVGTLLRKAGTKLQSKNVKLKNIKPGLTIEDVSKAPLPKGKGEILRTTPLKTGDYLYHGTPNKFPISQLKPQEGGINNFGVYRYFTKDKSFAAQYGDKIIDVKIPKSYKIKNFDGIPQQEEIDNALKKGYDAVSINSGEEVLVKNYKPLIEETKKEFISRFKSMKEIRTFLENDFKNELKRAGYSNEMIIKHISDLYNKNIFDDIVYEELSKYGFDTKSQLISEWNKAQKLKSTPLKSLDDSLIQEAKKYKSAEEFVRAHSLYHGTPAKLEGNKLSFGKGDIKKGGQSGGLFLTDNPNSAKTFAFGGEVYQATPEIKNQVIDLTKKEGIDKFKSFIGKSYKTMEGDIVTFDKYSFDSMFPNGKADFATVSQFPELVEKIVKDNKLKGIAFNEFAGGEVGKTYQILSGDIPVRTKSQLISEWNKAQKLKSTPLKSLDDNLIQEAKKYKSADEFIKANLNKADYRSAHQLSLSNSITADKIDIQSLKEAIRTRNGYLNKYNLTDLKKLEKLKNNPDADVVIYRASPKNELNDGDWVTTDKVYANDIKRQNGGKVYSYTAKVKDLRFPKDVETLPSLSMASTFSYSPKTSQLLDIWKKAQKLK